MRERFRAAAMAAGLYGTFTLLLTLRAWHDRPHVDVDVAVGLSDACLVLGLAVAVVRGNRPAVIGLLVLTVVRLIYSRWNGYPLVAAIPDLAAAAFYLRALPR
jgi:hypothetical protein